MRADEIAVLNEHAIVIQIRGFAFGDGLQIRHGTLKVDTQHLQLDERLHDIGAGRGAVEHRPPSVKCNHFRSPFRCR